MAYFKDRSVYKYCPGLHNEPASQPARWSVSRVLGWLWCRMPFGRPRVVNVGWLSHEHPFPTGPLAAEVLLRLQILCQRPVAIMRGFHLCELCSEGTSARDRLSDKHANIRSYGEIRIESVRGLIYAAPMLIHHYVAVHNYLPPQGFLDALMDVSMPSQLMAPDLGGDEPSSEQ
jgi:hypothetical protein